MNPLSHTQLCRAGGRVFGCLVVLAVGLSGAELTWTATQVETDAFVGARFATAEFEYTNNNEFPVTLADIRPDCHCAAVEPASREIAPHAKGRLRVKIEVGDAT